MQKTLEPFLIDNKFQELYKQFQELYNSKKYFELIDLYELFLSSHGYKDHCFVDFNIVVDITLYVALVCFNLNEYEKAKRYLVDFEEIYLSFKHRYCYVKERLQKKNFSTISEPASKILVGYMNDTLRDFNRTNKVRFYNNLGYAYYKCGQYKEAVRHYKKILAILPNNIQLIVGYHQAVYYSTTPHHLKKMDRILITRDINKIKRLDSNYDTYLALGKLYYFLEEFSMALNYINIAISYIKQDADKSHREISAYDWISRIAYKQKQYATAGIFYEKIIDELVKDSNTNLSSHEEIHPKPELYKMLSYLNETKQHIADEETSKLNKTIWAGIIITSIFGLIDCTRVNPFSWQTCTWISISIFILSCIIIRSNIKFFDFLKKWVPTYYKIAQYLFKRIS